MTDSRQTVFFSSTTITWHCNTGKRQRLTKVSVPWINRPALRPVAGDESGSGLLPPHKNNSDCQQRITTPLQADYHLSSWLATEQLNSRVTSESSVIQAENLTQSGSTPPQYRYASHVRLMAASSLTLDLDFEPSSPRAHSRPVSRTPALVRWSCLWRHGLRGAFFYLGAV